MLVYLSVEDIVLIEKLEINLSNGFTVLTGETGAGKSILIDAVSLILGKRSEKRLIRKGKDKGTVTALFQLNKAHVAIKFAEKNGFTLENEIIFDDIELIYIIRESSTEDYRSQLDHFFK